MNVCACVVLLSSLSADAKADSSSCEKEQEHWLAQHTRLVCSPYAARTRENKLVLLACLDWSCVYFVTSQKKLAESAGFVIIVFSDGDRVAHRIIYAVFVRLFFETCYF